MSWSFLFKKRAAPPIESLSDDALVALVQTYEPSFERPMLEQPDTLLTWLCAHARAFDRQADAKPSVRAATGIDAFARWADDQDQLAAALKDESTGQWSLLGHGEQTYLYWDRSASPAPRVVELDHEQRMGDVRLHDWRGARQVLLGLWARWAGERGASGVVRLPGVAERACYCSVHAGPK